MALAAEVPGFDAFDAPARCHELIKRCEQLAASPLGASGAPIPWKWDVLELLDESRAQLRAALQANQEPDRGLWQEIREALANESTASTLPVALRKQCEELLGNRPQWLQDFEAELNGTIARGKELRERLLFEGAGRGWFGASGAGPSEVARLLERHLDLHQRATRLSRQLKLLGRALQQQGAMSSRRRAFKARTVSEKLQSSLLCLAAVAVAPVPGSSEMWLATTTMMWLDRDQAWQHVVYEHPRDADIETILSQFQCHSDKARRALAAWLALPPAKRRGCVLIHNASVRRVLVKTHLVNCIDGFGDRSADWTSALEHHPLGSVVKKALTYATSRTEEEGVVVGAQQLAVVELPPRPDANWGWRGAFSYGDVKVGECRLREGGVFSFICVDCGLRVGDRGERDAAEDDAGNGMEAGAEPGSPAAAEDAAVHGPEGAATTTVEVVNETEEPVSVRIFEPKHSHAPRLFRYPLDEGVILAGRRRAFRLQVAKPSKAGTEGYFDVEVRVGSRKAKCEVVGDQVIYVDGILADS